MTLILLLISSFLIRSSLQQEGCGIFNNINELFEPIFLSRDYEFLYPRLEDGEHAHVKIPIGESILISCPGGAMSVADIDLNRTEIAICNSDSLFQIGDLVFNQTNIICNNTLFNIGSIRETNSSCGVNETGTLIELGYDIEFDNQFIIQSLICFDKQDLIAQYVYHNVTPYTQYEDGYYVNAPYIQDSFYNQELDLGELYNATNQRKILNPLLGLPEDSYDYFTDGVFITPSILTDVAAFMYGRQQIAAYRFINAAPMWLGFDFFGNWDSIHSDIRQFSINYALNLDVYSGSHGVLTLPHNNTGEAVEIYLHQDNNSDALRVPEIYWIVAYEPNTKKAVTAVLHNNPYLNMESVVNVCQDISEDVSWLNWNFPEPENGYVYVCSYEDLKAAVEEVPELEVTGILY